MDQATRKALFEAVEFALRKLDPWPPKDPLFPHPKAGQFAGRVVEQLERAGWRIEAPSPAGSHSISNGFKG